MKCRLKELRENSGHSQSELAAILNISQQTILSVEGGKAEVPIELAVKAADFFCVSLEYFLCLNKELHRDFLEEYVKLSGTDQKAVKNIIHNLKKVQDMYQE